LLLTMKFKSALLISHKKVKSFVTHTLNPPCKTPSPLHQIIFPQTICKGTRSTYKKRACSFHVTLQPRLSALRICSFYLRHKNISKTSLGKSCRHFGERCHFRNRLDICTSVYIYRFNQATYSRL